MSQQGLAQGQGQSWERGSGKIAAGCPPIRPSTQEAAQPCGHARPAGGSVPASLRTPTLRPDGHAEGTGGPESGPRTLYPKGHLLSAPRPPPQWLIYFRAPGGRAGPGREGGAEGPEPEGGGGGAGAEGAGTEPGRGGRGRGGRWGRGGAPGEGGRDGGRGGERGPVREGAGGGRGEAGVGVGVLPAGGAGAAPCPATPTAQSRSRPRRPQQ